MMMIMMGAARHHVDQASYTVGLSPTKPLSPDRWMHSGLHDARHICHVCHVFAGLDRALEGASWRRLVDAAGDERNRLDVCWPIMYVCMHVCSRM